MKYLIVGVDPGKTAAVACMDLHGNVVQVSSKRFAQRTWFIDILKAAGSPVVIASDKKRPNRLVTDLAAIFDAALFSPASDVVVSRKKEIMRSHPSLSNLHERDALSAALTAYHHYANKLKQAEKNAEGRKYDDVDKVMAMVIKRYSMDEAISGKTKVGRFVRS